MEAFIWIAYWSGVFIFPIVVMAWLGKDFSWNTLNLDDIFDLYTPLMFLSFLWPFLLGFAILIGIVALAITIILGACGLWLSIVGSVRRILGVGKRRATEE